MKRFLSVLLCAVMLFGLLPVFPAVSAAADTVILEDTFQDYGAVTTVNTSLKGWSEFNARCHSLVTDGNNTYAKLTRGLTSTGGTENAPRARKNVTAAAGDIYMIQSDVMMSEKGIMGFYIRLNSTSVSLVRFGGDILLNGAKTGYKNVADKWMTYQLYYKLADMGENIELYLRMWGEGVVDAAGNAVSASDPVVLSKTITGTLDFENYSDMWNYYQGSFGSGTADDYAAIDNVTLKKIGEELTDLSTLTVNGEEVPGFSPDKTTYDLELDYGTTEASVAATAGAGKTVTIDCSTVTDFPRGVNITVTNNTLGISKTYTVNLSVSSSADFDVILDDNFEAYGDAEKVTNSVKGWNQITAASHSLVIDGTTRALKLALVGTEKSPRARKNITAQVGDTIQVQADFKLSENGYIGLYLRNNSKTESIHLLKNTDVLINGASTGYEIDPEKWFTCNTHVKLAANGGLMEIYMCLWGEGVVDREGNAATRENPVKLSRTVNTVLDLESNSTLTIDFMGNFSKADSTDYALVDNVVMTKLHSDVAGLTNLTVNETAVETVAGTDNRFSIMLPYGTNKAIVAAEAGYGRTVTISQSEVTKFPTEVTVTVENASAGVTKTYTVTVDARRTATQMESELMPVYGGANGIYTATFDDGLYNTAMFLDRMGAKYDIYSSAMMLPSKLSVADQAKWQLLFDRGYVEPQNHSMTHLVFPNESWSDANNGAGLENNTPENYQYEIVDSKALLEEYFGNDIICYAASNNTLSDGAWEVVKDSHYAARLGYRGVNSLDPQETTDPGGWYNLKCVWFSVDIDTLKGWIDTTVEQGGWFVGGCHGIGDLDRNGDISIKDAETLFALVSAYQKENKLWATTFSNATKYVRQRQNSLCYVDWIDGDVIVEVLSNGKLDPEVFDHALTVKAQIPAGWEQVRYTCNGEEFTADVFEEEGKYWAYINVQPDTRVTVREAKTYEVLFTDSFDDYNPDLGDTITNRGWKNFTSNSYLTVPGIMGDKFVQYTGSGTDYYPKSRVVADAKLGDTMVITGKTVQGAGATVYLSAYNSQGSTYNRLFYINDSGIYLGTASTGYKAVAGEWIHYELQFTVAENGAGTLQMTFYGGVKDSAGNVATSSNPAVITKSVTWKDLGIATNGNLLLEYMYKLTTAESYTCTDNVVIGTVKNDSAVLSGIQINGTAVENFHSAITQYDVKLDADVTEATVTATAAGTVSIDDATVTQFPATVKITVTVDGISKVYTLNLTKKISANEMDSQILPVYGGADSIVTMTYDDGYYDSLEILEQLLTTYDLQASAMMIAQRITDDNAQQFKDLFALGHIEPQNHSMTHLNLTENDTQENYQTEILDSKTRLENYFGNDILAYAAAYNVLSNGAWETVMDSHYAARLGAFGINSLDPANTTEAGGWYNLNNIPFKKSVSDQLSYLTKHLNDVANNGGWLVTMCHGVGAGTNSEITEANANAFFQRIADLEAAGKVWNATLGDATKYLRQYQNYTAHAEWLGGDVYVSLENTGIVLPEDVFDHPMTVKVQVPETWTQASYKNGTLAEVFTENGQAYICMDVIPGETVRVVDADSQVSKDESLKFSTASVTLYNDIAISFKVKPETLEGFTAPYVEFVFGGVKTKVETYEEVDGLYVFTFSNMAPNRMGDTIYATLHATKDGAEFAGNTLEYSIASYCYRMLSNATVVNDPAYAEFRTLLVDLLHYGAAAQVFTGYKTNTPADEDLTEAQLAWGTATDGALENKTVTKYATVENPTATWASVGLVLEDAVTMRFKFETADVTGLTVKITSDTNAAGWVIDAEDFQYEESTGRYYVDFGGLHAGQMRQCVYVTVCDGDTAISNTLRYAIESYAYKYADNESYPTLAALVKTMMRYGDAAYAFAN